MKKLQLFQVEYAHRKGQTEVPKYWGADGLGNETTDPTRILNGGGCLPIGSSGGYAPKSLSNVEGILHFYLVNKSL